MGIKIASSTRKSLTRQGVQFNIRMDAAVKERVERAAQATRQSLTEFTETALSEKAELVLAQHEQILLSDRDYDLFVTMMTSDTEPTKIAKQEAEEFRKGRMEGARYRW